MVELIECRNCGVAHSQSCIENVCVYKKKKMTELKQDEDKILNCDILNMKFQSQHFIRLTGPSLKRCLEQLGLVLCVSSSSHFKPSELNRFILLISQ